MQKSFMLATLLLGCCLAAVAQTNPPAASTPSTFPQDQTSPSDPATPTNPSALPPDTDATGQTTPASSSDSPNAVHGSPITAQGCLSQAADGNFILAETSGTQYRLRGDTALLATYLGNEVRVDGVPMTGDAANAGSMSSPTSSGSESSATQLRVTEIHKLSNICPANQ